MTHVATAKIDSARIPSDLFGELKGDPDEQMVKARALYLSLAKLTHPDAASNGDREEATRLFARLSELWEQTQKLIASGSYNDGGLTGLVVRTKRGVSYTIGGRIATGDIADVHALVGGVVIKVARHPRDNDLLRAEAATIKAIRKETADKHLIYLPQVLDSFGIRDATHHERAANVFAPLHAGKPEDADKWISLADVHRLVPAVNPRDAAWIWRRMLSAISLAHDMGYVHHAVLPEHVLILPPEHGVVLIDWCYARPFDAPPVALVPNYRDWHPEEVIAKGGSRPETDIAMAARTMIRILGGDGFTIPPEISVPTPIRAHLRACTLPKASMRPGDALGVLKSFDDILWRLWGKRQFREFKLPTT